MKVKNFIPIFLYIMYTMQAFGQYRPKENYPSPNVASLGEYGNIPVSMFTGTPNISIPLYEVQEGTLSLGFYANYDKLQSVNNQNTLGNHKDNFCGEINGTSVYELMTDEYSFHFGQYSGNFYLNEYGQWIVVSDDDIKVEFDPSTGFRTLQNLRSGIKTSNWSNRNSCNRFFDQFTLITPVGVKYRFGGKDATEYSISYYNRNNSYLVPTTWFLTQIESPEGYVISLFSSE